MPKKSKMIDAMSPAELPRLDATHAGNAAGVDYAG